MTPDFFSEFPDMGTLPDADMGGIFATVMIVYFGLILLAYAYSILVYILQSLGYYTVANRRGIKHPWMAWLPVCNMWIMGSISDQYQYVCKGKVTNRRKVLIGLTIAMFALMLVFFVAFFIGIFSGFMSEFDMNVSESHMAIPLIIALVAYVVMLVISIVLTVFQYVTVYDLFASCSPNNAVAFLVLSIFFSFLLPFFVFAVRKKDQGMPPRKPQPVMQHVGWQPPAPNPASTWQPPVQNTWQPPVQNAWQPPVQNPVLVQQQSAKEPAPEEEEPADPIEE